MSLTRALPGILAFLAVHGLPAATQITSNGITWKFQGDHPAGTFVTGDPWVIGPVTVVSITNELNSKEYLPNPGQNGSMVNPGTSAKQGYDSGLQNYDPSLNAALPKGQPVSAENPLELPAGSSVVSMVSWLYKSAEDREPGCPKFGGGATAPRPATRTAGILTVLDKAPLEGSFRPPYSGADKAVKFNTSQIEYAKLPSLETVGSAPDLGALGAAMEKPWVDHANGWLGAHIHPSEHMPNYGRDMGRIVVDSSLVLFIAPGKPGENPAKDKIARNLIQYGIDLTGIADNGGDWHADGGHGLGRKWPILLAGALLNDKHMLNAGQWPTRFQENEQTFYVTDAEVGITNGPTWNPDKRAKTEPYTTADIGLPEWGIRHSYKPEADNKDWSATYREVNGAVMPGFALAARLMNLKEAWNYNAFFDYCDRYMKWFTEENPRLANAPSPFLLEMWRTHRNP